MLPDDVERYAEGATIGEGGTATVAEAYDHRLKRQVALKRLHGELLRDADYRRRFVEEAQAAAQLEHPNVVPIYDLAPSSARTTPWWPSTAGACSTTLPGRRTSSRSSTATGT